MKKFSYMLAALALMAIGLNGCKTAQKNGEDNLSPSNVNSASSDDNTLGDSDNGKAMGLKTVNFAYDSFKLDTAANEILKSNAQILKDKPSIKIQLEGHCDARGGIQYNLALGEKRANAVKNALTEKGINADRITTISYGKERLLDNGSTDAAHAKNRRANFVITSK